MIADLLIDKESFCCGDLSPADVAKRIGQFSEMVVFATSGVCEGDNRFIVGKKEFLQTMILGDLKVEDLLFFSDKARNLLPNDVISNFIDCFKRFRNPEKYPKTSQTDIQEATCVLRKVEPDANKIHIIATIRELGKFRCQFFIDKSDSDSYFDEAEKYMRGLALHPGIKKEYKDVFKSHKTKINHCLWIMEEKYIEFFNSFVENKVKCIEQFAIKNNLYDGGSYEGSDKFKGEDLRFEDRDEKVYCEPHIKMNSDDKGNQRKYCRIYFEEPRHNLCKVYIGHICKHK